jgi:hypothetical protein
MLGVKRDRSRKVEQRAVVWNVISVIARAVELRTHREIEVRNVYEVLCKGQHC